MPNPFQIDDLPSTGQVVVVLTSLSSASHIFQSIFAENREQSQLEIQVGPLNLLKSHIIYKYMYIYCMSVFQNLVQQQDMIARLGNSGPSGTLQN